jgi:response regulator RpfG family c-di-GMP phosphodiesterase
MAFTSVPRDSKRSRRGAVLCVDDEPQVLSALQRALRHEPYEVVTAADPDLALDCLERLPVEVVIADERMPRMTGSDLLAEVHRRWPWMGRVILTGYPGPQIMIRGLESRVDFLLYKPWDDDALRKSIGRLVHEVERMRDPKKHSEPVETDDFDLGGEGG